MYCIIVTFNDYLGFELFLSNSFKWENIFQKQLKISNRWQSYNKQKMSVSVFDTDGHIHLIQYQENGRTVNNHNNSNMSFDPLFYGL